MRQEHLPDGGINYFFDVFLGFEVPDIFSDMVGLFRISGSKSLSVYAVFVELSPDCIAHTMDLPSVFDEGFTDFTPRTEVLFIGYQDVFHTLTYISDEPGPG